MLKRVAAFSYALVIVCLSWNSVSAADRPNILWVSVEDISAHLGCYGDTNATTPNLDAFADQSVRYTSAFTCHGVCAPSRTGIITAMWPDGLGANHMRSKATLPPHIQCFPHYLKESGYYCTNNSKTDYNFHWTEEDVWNESSGKAHWKNRPDPNQPFFAVFNLTMTHESRIWPQNWKNVVKNVPPEKLHRPDDMKVAPLYPDTPEVRAAYARLLDIIMVMDETFAGYLKELEAAGLADDTIVIFWSDHGNGFPRAKRWVYETGTHVPLMVRIPEKFRVDGQGQPGSVNDQLISLIDLGPTMLNLAGLTVPDNMQGQPFLGANVPKPRQYIYGARDRVDERFDMVRSVRDQQYRYVRNFLTWRPALQHINYSENSVVRKEMRRLLAEGQLAKESAQFFAVPRPIEELYDVKKDPLELHNLANDPAFADVLQRMSSACDRWQTDIRDAHLLPEILLDQEEQKSGSRWDILHAEGGEQRTRKLLEIAKLSRRPSASDQAQLLKGISDSDSAIRWWAVTGLANLSSHDSEIQAAIEKAGRDSEAAVRIAAARGLNVIGKKDDAIAVLTAALDIDNDFVRHAALIELDEMGSAASAARPAIERLSSQLKKNRKSSEYVSRVIEHALTTLNP